MRKLLITITLLFLSGPVLAQENVPETTFDGLQRVEGSRLGAAYIDPEADFSAFRRVAILDPIVAFRSNWLRDANRSRAHNINSRDMDRIKADMQSIFRTVFTERLEAAGFQVVNTADFDVLVLRPAIVDLNVTAPDVPRGGRTRTYTASSGAATLYLQLVDSVSGDVIGRAIDRSVARNAGQQLQWSNRMTSRQDARRAMGRWADTLVEFLTSQYMPVPEEDAVTEALAIEE